MKGLVLVCALLALSGTAAAQQHAHDEHGPHGQHAGGAAMTQPPIEPRGHIESMPPEVELRAGERAEVVLRFVLLQGDALAVAPSVASPDAIETTIASPIADATRDVPAEAILILTAREGAAPESVVRVTAPGFEAGEVRVRVAAPPPPPAVGGGSGWGASAAATAGIALVAWALYSRLQPREVLAHPARADLLALVRAEPGITLARAREQLGLAKGALSHHLAKLERAGHLHSIRDGNHRRLFAAGDRADVAPEMRARVAALARSGTMGASDIAKELGISRQLAHYHLRALRESTERASS